MLNNDFSILPDVAIQLYSSITPTLSPSDTLLATLFQVTQLKINGLLCGFYSTESKTAQLVAKIYEVPQVSGTSISASLSSKSDYPYFARIGPVDSIQIDGIIQLYIAMGWTRGIVIYTDDDFGSGYNQLVSKAQDVNITLLSVSVSATAVNASGVAESVDVILDTVQKSGYRTFVFYTINGPGQLVRQAMNQSGLFGPDYVYILTAPSVNPYVTGNLSNPLNDGAIGFAFGAPAGIYQQVYNAWANDTTNPWPAPPISSIPLFAWYDLDAFYSFIYSFDTLMKSGVNYSDITGPIYLNAILTHNFTGVTGPIALDKYSDNLGNYDLFTMRTQGVTKVGNYDALKQKLTLSGNFVFTGGETAVPRDGPYECDVCEHGQCVENVGCVCYPGYHGKYCSSVVGNSIWTVGLAVGVVVLLLVGAGFGFFIYRKKRMQLVKQVAEKQRSNINRADIVLGPRVGRGASGEVFKSQFRGTEVAVKKIVALNIDNKVIQDFEMEVAIMCGLRHPNIILFMGSCFDAKTKEMLLVMEYMTKGSLHDVLHNPKIELTFDMKIHLAVQAAQGMNFLHQSSPPIIHSDLKSHNILLDDKWNSKISDFGITKFKKTETKNKDASQHKQNNTCFGTIYWTAPEALSGSEPSEKSDVYSFGIILWEIFHRQNPYFSRDPVSVAIDVIVKNLRPIIDMSISYDIRALIESCWHKDPETRPSFQDVANSLRTLSGKHPIDGAYVAPTGFLYLVNTSIVGATSLWEAAPVQMLKAVELHNILLREKAALYRGYEAQFDASTLQFIFAFNRVDDALNFCVETQLELKKVAWPEEVLRIPGCATVRSNTGTVLWRGLRSRMSVISGVPNCEVDQVTGRMTYIGPVIEKSRKILRSVHEGNIIIADPVRVALEKTHANLVNHAITQPCIDWTLTGDNAERIGFHRVMISGYDHSIAPAIDSPRNHPHIIDVEEADEEPSTVKTVDNAASWIVKHEDIQIGTPIGKGNTGDYNLAVWNRKEVVVKTLTHQKLKESDLLKLTSTAAYMSKMFHPNVLAFHGVCLDAGHVALINECMPHGNLKDLLASSVSLSLPLRMKFALDIAQGMKYLDNCKDCEEISKHDSLKSCNILIGKDWEVKVADYGQGLIKDMAKTMTSIANVAWTAPEILAGEERTTPKIATYAFGIILWEIYTRDIPYLNEHPIRIVTKILTGFRPPIPGDCPNDIQQLIMDCWCNEPKGRPAWDNIVARLADIVQVLM